MDTDADADLLERLRSGDEAAFATLVQRYQVRLLRLAESTVGSRAVAEEAVQDTWLAVVRGLERFEGRSSFKTWLFRILRQPGAHGGWPRAAGWHPADRSRPGRALRPVGGVGLAARAVGRQGR